MSGDQVIGRIRISDWSWGILGITDWLSEAMVNSNWSWGIVVITDWSWGILGISDWSWGILWISRNSEFYFFLEIMSYDLLVECNVRPGVFMLFG